MLFSVLRKTLRRPHTPSQRADKWEIENLEPRVLLSGPFGPNDRVAMHDNNVNVRATPSPTGAFLRTQSTGALGSVSAGPTAAGGFTWYNVNWDSGADGWSAD